MRLSPFQLLAFASVLLAGPLGGCASNADDGTPAADDDLTGGKVAVQGDFAPTMNVNMGYGACTGSKVGPKHVLLAAHCIKPEVLVAGASITVNDGVSPSADRNVSLKVERVAIHPLWSQFGDAQNAESPPDVAVIIVEANSAFARIPAAEVDLTPVKVGEEMTITGYGCEKGLHSMYDFTARLKTAATKSVGVGVVKSSNNVVSVQNLLPRSYFFTPGKALSNGNASICPGDSGGPVYRGKDPRAAKQKVIGVNAYYGFNDGGNVSTTNWHTRLDVESRVDIGTWISLLGVDVTGSAPSTDHYRDCTQVGAHDVCGVLHDAFEKLGGSATLGAPQAVAKRLLLTDGSWVWAQQFKNRRLQVSAALESPTVDDVK